ncbi:MAG TPA: tetratricopeptide repeat protein, partial [Acidobacteria bacterium]|nr:tetratricopeptide repeat protein [Acidobacteriota bacterium]
MRRWFLAVAGAVILAVPVVGTAGEPATAPTPEPSQVGVADRPEGEPIFFRWLDPRKPGDATILDYWKRYESNTLKPREMVDLGTMLFKRGWPKDAIRVYEAAGKADPGLYEAWFRAGLVKHSLRDLGGAKKCYKKCLKILVGNGWCNFYMGLVEEQTYNGSTALKYFEKAFSVDPELADPKVNPAVLESRIARAAAGVQNRRDIFRSSMPMGYLEPKEVETTRARYTVQERKTKMWEDQARRAKNPPAPPHASRQVPHGAATTHAPTPIPGRSRTATMSSSGAHGKSVPHRPTPVTPPRPTPVPPRPPAVAPPAHGTTQVPKTRGGKTVYPWGGGPIPPQTANPPVAKTP